MDVQVVVDPINDPPFIHVPEFIILKSDEYESLIYNAERDKFEFSIGDPDLQGFPSMVKRRHSQKLSSVVIETCIGFIVKFFFFLFFCQAMTRFSW